MRKIERLAMVAAIAALAMPVAAAAQTSGAALIAAGDQVRAKLTTAAKGAAPSLRNADAALAMRQKVLTFVDKATPAARGQITALANAFATSKCNLLCQTAGTY